MDVSENNGTPKSSILIGFSIINHPFWGTPIFRKHRNTDLFPCSTKDVVLLTSSQVGLNLGPERQDYVKRFRGEVTGWVA